jgi:hypothetical protein
MTTSPVESGFSMDATSGASLATWDGMDMAESYGKSVNLS